MNMQVGSSLNSGDVLGPGPNILRRPYKKDPKRDPYLENYPCSYRADI